MFTKDIFKTHKDNLEIVREMRVMNGMITAGLSAISQFWAGYYSSMFAGGDEKIMEMSEKQDDDKVGDASLIDAKMVSSINEAMELERNSNMSRLYRASARKRYELASYAKLLFMCLSHPKEQAEYMESAYQANDFLNELRGEKVTMLKLLTTRLANIKYLASNKDFQVQLTEESDGRLNGLIMSIVQFIMEHEYNDESFGVLGISMEELTIGGLSEDDAQEFMRCFSKIDNVEDIQKAEQAKKEGKLSEFARAFLKEKRNGH